jgi:hypothetical protein
MPHPLVVQTAQAAVLSATSNIIAQTINSYKLDVSSGNQQSHMDRLRFSRNWSNMTDSLPTAL